MGNKETAPAQIVLEYLRANGEPVRKIDLGAKFLDDNQIDGSKAMETFRIAMEKKSSKAGNAYYDYSQNAVPLPDGLATFLRVEGVIIPMGKTRPSGKGYPTREGHAQLVVGNTIYRVTTYLTESQSPFFVKVVAHKQPDNERNIQKAQAAPRGGMIL